MEVCEGELDIDRWELFSLVKTGGWTKVTSPETVAKAARCVLGPRVLSATGRDALEANIKYFLANLIKRWVQCGRREDRFRTKHEKWMASKETVNVEFVAETEEPCADSHSSSFRQRPSFSDLSERSKRRRSMEVASEHEAEELLKAAGQRARKEKKHDLAYLATEAGTSPGRPKKIRTAYREKCDSADTVGSFSPDEALAMMVAGNMSKESYRLFARRTNEKTKSKVYPSYDRVLEARSAAIPRDCYARKLLQKLQYRISWTTRVGA